MTRIKINVRKRIFILNYLTIGIPLLIMFLSGQIHAKRNTLNSGSFLKVVNNTFIVNGSPFIMKGFNYYPRNYGWCDMAKWDTNEVKQELGKTQFCSANILRIFIDYGFSTDSIGMGIFSDSLAVVTHCHPSKEYIDAMQKFVELARRYNLRVIITLFDFMPGWAFLEQRGKFIWAAKAYLTDIVNIFKNDSTVAAYDLLNEGDYISDQFNIPIDTVLNFYKEIADTLKHLDTNHLITAGFMDIERAHYTKNFVDFVSFHYFGDLACLGKKIRSLKDSLKSTKPICAEEIGYSSKPVPSSTDTSSHTIFLGGYLDIILNSEKLPGTLIWSLTEFNTPTITRNRGIPSDTTVQKHYGVYRTDLSEKPSVLSVNNYFRNQYTISNRLCFKFSKITLSGDNRYLAFGLHRGISFLTKDMSVIDSIQAGSTKINQMQGQGWSWNEKWYDYYAQWSGNMDSIANIYVSIPKGTDSIRLRLHSFSDSTKLIISYSTEALDTIMLSTPPANFIIPGPSIVKNVKQPYNGNFNKKKDIFLATKVRIINLMGKSIIIPVKSTSYKNMLSELHRNGFLAKGIYIIEEISGNLNISRKFITIW